MNLEQEYEKYCEHNRIYDEMVQLFLETEYQLLVPRIMDIVEKRNSNKVIYLNTLKISLSHTQLTLHGHFSTSGTCYVIDI